MMQGGMRQRAECVVNCITALDELEAPSPDAASPTTDERAVLCPSALSRVVLGGGCPDEPQGVA